MCRVKFTTTLDSELIDKAKKQASIEDLEGANAVIEKALKLYFANYNVVVWEKSLSNGLLQKLILRPSKMVFENIQKRVIKNDYDESFVSDAVMIDKGFQKVWQMKSVN